MHGEVEGSMARLTAGEIRVEVGSEKTATWTEPVAGLVELATKRVTARVQRTPLWPARRLAKWRNGLMWPWDGYGSVKSLLLHGSEDHRV